MSKIIAGGGQKYYKNRLNLSDCLLGKENSGTVLIEFAVCIPILVILLFYANDLVRLYRYHSQTEFVAQQIVNILQNISQKREDKTITRKDLGLSLCLAGLTVYPDSLSMFQDGSKKYRFCHIPQVMVFYVKGLDNGNASCMWRMFLGFNEASTQSPANANAGIYHNDNTGTVVRYKTEVPPSEIYSGLKINPGEVKIIVDSCLYRNSDRMTTLEGTFPSHKEAFGFYLLNPKHVDESSKSHYFFHSVIIFTPKPGLFSETNPK